MTIQMIPITEWLVSPFTFVLLITSIGLLVWLYQKQIKTTVQLSMVTQQAQTATQTAETHWQALQVKTAEVQALQLLGVEAKQWEAQLQELKPHLEQLQQTHHGLAIEKAGLLAEKAGLAQQLAALKAQWEQQQTEWKTLWEAQLKNHLTETLTQANKTLKLSAEQEEQQRLQGFKQLTAPIQTMLQEYEQKITSLNKGYTDNVAVLRSEVERLRSSSDQLASVMKTNKGAGDWGELQLLQILEFAGLQKNIHYSFQAVQEDKSRTDVKILLPQNRFIVIDAKATQISTTIRDGTARLPLASATVNEAEIDTPIEVLEAETSTNDAELVKSIKTAVKDLASKMKSYNGYGNNTPEFMVLFLPKESLLSQAMATDPLLWGDAWRNNVVISSPLTLIPLLRMVNIGWHQENIAANTNEIQKLGKELHEKLVSLAIGLDGIMNTYGTLGNKIDDLKTKFKGKQGLVNTVKKLEKLQAHSGSKKLPLSFEDDDNAMEEAEAPVPIALPELSSASNN
jgi:DNA recombination protein RmuC